MQHSDPEAIRKSIRTYLMIGAALYVFTVITVAVNQVHLAVPLAITVALIVATMKGSMVASVFMHLNHEKKWIYGSLVLTVVFFIVLMSVPFLTIHNTTGRPLKNAATSAFQEEAVQGSAGAAAKEH
jgi:cytochrome c oxidase subunit 4